MKQLTPSPTGASVVTSLIIFQKYILETQNLNVIKSYLALIVFFTNDLLKVAGFGEHCVHPCNKALPN